MPNQEEFLERIAIAVKELEPSAEIFLYGSQARGNAAEDSDWDFLILLDHKVNPDITDRIRHCLYEIEWETDTVISSIIRNQDHWHDAVMQQTPFYQAVETDAVLISA